MMIVAPPVSQDTTRQIVGICQEAATVLGIPRPDVVFGSDVTSAQELANIATECAQRVASAHDWTALRRTASLQGDGETLLDLPTDFGRLTDGAKAYSSATGDNLLHIAGADNFAKTVARATVLPSKIWMQTGLRIEVHPALAAGEVVTVNYISSAIVLSTTNDGTTFVSDDDSFALSPRLLTLGIVWEWRKQKGLPYAEDLQTYEIALTQAIAADNGQAGQIPATRASGNA